MACGRVWVCVCAFERTNEATKYVCIHRHTRINACKNVRMFMYLVHHTLCARECLRASVSVCLDSWLFKLNKCRQRLLPLNGNTPNIKLCSCFFNTAPHTLTQIAYNEWENGKSLWRIVSVAVAVVAAAVGFFIYSSFSRVILSFNRVWISDI